MLEAARRGGGSIGAPLAFIGGGNMAGAIIAGATRAEALAGGCVVADPDTAKLAAFDVGARTAGDALDWLARRERTPGEGVVVLAIKPQMLDAVGREVAPVLAAGPERLVITILVGTPSARVREAMGGNSRVVRVMPNTPAMVGEGMSAVAAGAGATPEDVALTRTLFEACGRVVELPEDRIDAFSTFAGSGPAYLFYLAEAMERAAVEMGFAVDDARAIVAQTLYGSAMLLRRDGRPPAELRRAVTSPNGTTQAATTSFDGADVQGALVRGMHAAAARAAELARGG